MGTTVILLNEGYRKKCSLPPASYSSVNRFVLKSRVIRRSYRQTKKSGKDDADTEWSKARMAIAKQLQEQLAAGTSTASTGTASVAAATDEAPISAAGQKRRRSGEVKPTAPVAHPFPPISLHAIAWWDEHHKKTILGHTSKHEYRICRNDKGQPALPADGGTFPAAMPNTSQKYPGEARGLFGVAVVKGADGHLEGKKAMPFQYTGCQVVGFEQFKRECAIEIRRAAALKKVSRSTGRWWHHKSATEGTLLR